MADEVVGSSTASNSSNNMESNKCKVSRDIQLLIGEQIIATANFQHGKYITAGFFNLLTCTPTVRAAALKALSKLSILILNSSKAKLCTADGKHSLKIDFGKLSGYLYLKRLIAEVRGAHGDFLKELHLLSLQELDVPKLMDILAPLTGLALLSLPFVMDNCRSSKWLERLVQNNAGTLVALKHLSFPMALPPREMHSRLTAVNCSTLRNGTMDKEQDFFAYYTDGAKYPDSFGPLPPGEEQEAGAVVLRISIHRHKDALTRVARALAGSSLLSKFTVLKFTSTTFFDTGTAQKLLAQLASAKRLIPNLTRLEFELKMLDSYPDSFPDEHELEEGGQFSHVSPGATNWLLLANRTLAWLQAQKLPFQVGATVRLAVDYLVNEGEDSRKVLEQAMKETKAFFGQRMPEMEWNTASGGRFLAIHKVAVKPECQLQFVLDYTSLSFNSRKCDEDELLFRIGGFFSL